MIDLPGLFASQKRIALFTGWSPPDTTGYCTFAAPLMIGGVVQENFSLHGGCYRNVPDRHVTFELVLGRTLVRRRAVLERLDWRSLQGGHSNKKNRPVGLVRRTSSSHIHSFDLNYLPNGRRMKPNNLPLAKDFPYELGTFEDLRAFVGERFSITNIDVVLPPDWEYRLPL